MTITSLLQIVQGENHAVFIYTPIGYLEILGQRALISLTCIRKASLRLYMAEQRELDEGSLVAGQRELDKMREVFLSPSVSSKATSSTSSYRLC